MIAWTHDRYGGPETLRQEQLEAPALGPGEVRIRIAATALNSADLRLMRGRPYLIRLGFGLRQPRVRTPGRDVAGVVTAVGAGAEWRIGERVVGELAGAGGLAEEVIAPASQVVAIPGGLADQVAVALPMAGGTAWQALDRAGVTDGSKVLVLGAGGGVGSFAVRLAVLRGARVHALCRAQALPAVGQLGAAVVEDRTKDLAELPAGRFDAVLDLGGRAPLASLQRLIRDGGAVVGVSVGDQVIRRLLGAGLRSLGSRRPIRALFASPRPEITQELLDLAASGDLAPLIDDSLPMSEAPVALKKLEAGEVVGKLVLVPNS